MRFNKIVSDALERFDVSEWDADAEAYVKDLTALERLVFNDHFLTFYDKDKPAGDRFHAGFRSAQIALVDKTGAPIINDADEEAASKASLDPILRLFTHYLKTLDKSDDAQLETAKKN